MIERSLARSSESFSRSIDGSRPARSPPEPAHNRLFSFTLRAPTRLESYRLEATLQDPLPGFNAVAVTRDGRHALAVSGDRTIRIWSLHDLRCLMTHRSDAGFASVAVSDHVLCAGDGGGGVWLFDLPSWMRPAP